MLVMLGKKCTKYYNRSTIEYPVARLIVKTKMHKYEKNLDPVFLIFLNWYCTNV